MAQAKPPAAAGPSAWVKRAATVVILWHGFAILTAVTGGGSNQYPAPELVALTLEKVTKPYLQSVFMTNPYRFFAPDPGPTTLIWFHLRYRDKTDRWLELPRRDDFASRMPYQRYLALFLLFDGHQMEDPQNPGGKVMRPEGVACLRSFVRHLGETEQKVGPDGQAIPVDTVSVYAVYHAPLMPYQIQAGWDPFDLRLYNGAFLGDYTAAADGIVKNHPVPPGTRLDCDRPEIHRAENVAQIVANLLQSEVEPLLRRVPPQERAARLAEARLPEAVDHFLRDYPPILDKLYPMPAGMLPKAKEEQLKNLRLEIERCFPTSNPDGEAK